MQGEGKRFKVKTSVGNCTYQNFSFLLLCVVSLLFKNASYIKCLLFFFFLTLLKNLKWFICFIDACVNICTINNLLNLKQILNNRTFSFNLACRRWHQTCCAVSLISSGVNRFIFSSLNGKEKNI